MMPDRARARPRRRADRRCSTRSPGETAVDCTFGGGGHARLIAERIGPEGDADRDRPRPRRGGALRARSPPRRPAATRFLARRLRGRASQRLRGEGIRPDMDRTWTSACPRCRSTPGSAASPTPTTRRSTCGWTRRQELSAPPTVVNEWPESRIAQALRALRRGALRRRDRARDRPPPPAARPPPSWSTRSRPGCRPSARFGARPSRPSAPSRRSGSPSTASSTRSTTRCRLAWDDAAASAAASRAISFHSLEDRRVKRFLADRARGCICPPELPVCVCGREPEAELLTRRAVAPGPRGDRPPTRAPARPTCAPRVKIARGGGGRLMAAAATARTAARRAPDGVPRRKPPAAPALRPSRAAPRHAPARAGRRPGGQLIPIAVGTAAAVRDLPDSSLIVRLTRGRAWIGVLGVLLVGIVALNVVTPQPRRLRPATSTRTSTRSKTENSVAARPSTRSAPAAGSQRGRRGSGWPCPTRGDQLPRARATATPRVATCSHDALRRRAPASATATRGHRRRPTTSPPPPPRPRRRSTAAPRATALGGTGVERQDRAPLRRLPPLLPASSSAAPSGCRGCRAAQLASEAA